jgi:hypothetical protein
MEIILPMHSRLTMVIPLPTSRLCEPLLYTIPLISPDPQETADLPSYVGDFPINNASTLGAIIMATHIQQYYPIFVIQPWPRMSTVIPPATLVAGINPFPQI